MKFNYIQDMIRSGVGEDAVLIKRPFENNEFGDPVYDESQEERYEFLTIADSLDRAENEQEAGDFIEGDFRFYVSSEIDLDFENGDFIEYEGREYNITSVNRKTIGEQARHKEIIVENV